MTEQMRKRRFNRKCRVLVQRVRENRLKIMLGAILIIMAVSLFTPTVSADENVQPTTILFTSPLAQYLLPTTTKKATPSATTVQQVITNDKWGQFVQAVKKVAPIYNYPANVILAQGALESAHGTSEYAVDRNNFLGIGAYTDDPDEAFNFENPEQCVIEYLLLIRRNFPEAWQARGDAAQLLHLLESNSYGLQYATDPDYESKVMSQTEWSAN